MKQWYALYVFLYSYGYFVVDIIIIIYAHMFQLLI